MFPKDNIQDPTVRQDTWGGARLQVCGQVCAFVKGRVLKSICIKNVAETLEYLTAVKLPRCAK